MTPSIAAKEHQRLSPAVREKTRAPRQLEIAADSVGHEILVTYTYTCADGSIHYVQEIGGSTKALGLGAQETLSFLLEGARRTFEEFIEDGELNRLSLEWAPVTMDGREVRSRGCLTRPALDRLADALLAEDET